MTVIVTRNVPGRFRGFLASCMLEIGPGVYTAPKMNPNVRSRVWNVLTEWFEATFVEASIVMTWLDKDQPGGQGIMTLGTPPKRIVDSEGVHLCVGPYLEMHALASSLKKENADSPESTPPDVPF